MKSTLKIMGSLDKKCRQANVEADVAKGRMATPEIELQLEKADRTKDVEKAAQEKKTLTAKLEEYEAILLRISKDCCFLS